MLTYELKKSPGVPLYEALYRAIRSDILSGALTPGEKLPSKRALAANLEVSKITVEGAYNQLLAEGYIRSQEKVGYFVEEVERIRGKSVVWEEPEAVQDDCIDLTAFKVGNRLGKYTADLKIINKNIIHPFDQRVFFCCIFKRFANCNRGGRTGCSG